MKNITPAMILGSLALCGVVGADEAPAACPLCQKNKEYNASHPENNYYWYDDYLKDEKEGKAHKAHQNEEPAATTNPEKK